MPKLRVPSGPEPTADEMTRTYYWHLGVTDAAEQDKFIAAARKPKG